MRRGRAMRPRARYAVVAAACVAAVAAMFAGCPGKGKVEAKPEADLPAGAESVMKGVHVRQMVGGRMEVELWAAQAWHSQGAEWIRGRNVKAWYFPPGKKPATLYATEARYDVREQRLSASGNVRVESEGSVLETTQLTYDARRDKISTTRRVRVVRGGNVMTGVGMEADPDLGNLKVGEVQIDANRPGEIQPLLEGSGSKTR